MPIAPAVVRTKSARVDHRFNRITPAFPARMVYGLLRALPGEPSSFATVALRMTDASGPGRVDTSPQDLTPASGVRTTRLRRPRPSPPKVLPDLVPSGQFRRRWAAAPSVRAPVDRSRKTRPAIPSAPDTVASIASHRAFVTTRDPPLF